MLFDLLLVHFYRALTHIDDPLRLFHFYCCCITRHAAPEARSTVICQKIFLLGSSTPDVEHREWYRVQMIPYDVPFTIIRRLADVFATIGETAIQVPNEGNQLFLYTLAHTKKHIIY